MLKAPSLRVGREGGRGPVGGAEEGRADHAVLVCVDIFSGTNHELPPSGLGIIGVGLGVGVMRKRWEDDCVGVKEGQKGVKKTSANNFIYSPMVLLSGAFTSPHCSHLMSIVLSLPMDKFSLAVFV
jgi:hypothetical protein